MLASSYERSLVLSIVVSARQDDSEGEQAKTTWALFYPSDTVEKAKAGVLGAYLVTFSADENDDAFSSEQVHKILADSIVYSYQEEAAQLMTGRFEDVNAEEFEENFFCDE